MADDAYVPVRRPALFVSPLLFLALASPRCSAVYRVCHILAAEEVLNGGLQPGNFCPSEPDPTNVRGTPLNQRLRQNPY